MPRPASRSTFEILLDSGGLFERIVGPFAKTLERLGIKVDVRAVDDAQYENRLETFDFDMITGSFGQSRCRRATSSATSGAVSRGRHAGQPQPDRRSRTRSSTS